MYASIRCIGVSGGMDVNRSFSRSGRFQPRPGRLDRMHVVTVIGLETAPPYNREAVATKFLRAVLSRRSQDSSLPPPSCFRGRFLLWPKASFTSAASSEQSLDSTALVTVAALGTA